MPNQWLDRVNVILRKMVSRSRGMKSLAGITAEIQALAEVVGATSSQLPTVGHDGDGPRSNIEVHENGYHYVHFGDHGGESSRQVTKDFSELVYWVFEFATWCIAVDYELKNRIEDQDCRRIIFPRWLELMSRLGPKHAQRLSAYIADILSRDPYDDEPTRSVNRLLMRQERLARMRKISTPLIVMEAVLAKTCGQNLVDWSTKQIEGGVESLHLRELAASDPPYDHLKLADLRAKVFGELGIQLPSLDIAIGQYAAERLESTRIVGDVALIAVVVELHDLCIATDYNPEVYEFYILRCAYEDLKSGAEFSPHMREANPGNILTLMRAARDKFLQKYRKEP